MTLRPPTRRANGPAAVVATLAPPTSTSAPRDLRRDNKKAVEGLGAPGIDRCCLTLDPQAAFAALTG